MPDETTGAVATATPPSTPPVTPPSDTTGPGAGPAAYDPVRGDDFKEPTWGPKLRSLYDGLQEKGTKLSAAEKKVVELEKSRNDTQTWLADPRNAPQIRAYLDRIAPSAPVKPADPTEETDEERITRIATEKASAEVGTNQAMWEMFARLGQGDVEKGRQTYYTPDATGASLQRQVDDVLDHFIKGDPRIVSALALELVMSRRPKPTVTPEANGTVRTEAGPGSSEPPAAPTKISSAADMIRAAGFSSESEYLRALGRL